MLLLTFVLIANLDTLGADQLGNDIYWLKGFLYDHSAFRGMPKW